MRMRNTIYTDIVWKHKSRPPATAVALETSYVNYDNLADVKVQIGVTDKIIRLDHNSFVAWLARHKLGSQQINAELKKQFGMEIGNSSLGAGTRFVAAPMRTMEFNASSGAMNTLLRYAMNDETVVAARLEVRRLPRVQPRQRLRASECPRRRTYRGSVLDLRRRRPGHLPRRFARSAL